MLYWCVLCVVAVCCADLFSVFEGLDTGSPCIKLEEQEPGQVQAQAQARDPRGGQGRDLDFEALCTQLMPVKEDREGQQGQGQQGQGQQGGSSVRSQDRESLSRCRTFDSMQGFQTPEAEEGRGSLGSFSSGSDEGNITSVLLCGADVLLWMCCLY